MDCSRRDAICRVSTSRSSVVFLGEETPQYFDLKRALIVT